MMREVRCGVEAMAKFAVVDSYLEYAALAAAPLRERGHEVLIDTVPFDWDEVLAFGPQVIVFAIYRQDVAFNRPIQDPAQDILGFDAICEANAFPAIKAVPLVILAFGLHETDFEPPCGYNLFLTLPRDLALYPTKVAELAERRKARSKLSGYLCPNPGCRSRLVYFSKEHDLFCPRCGSAIAIIDAAHCTWLGPDGHTRACTVADLVPAPGG